MKTNYMLNEVQSILNIVGNKPNKILDVGCNTGEFGKTLKIINPNFYVEGIDISDEYLKLASKHYDKVLNINLDNLIDLDIYSKNNQDKFDIIILRDVIEHLQKPFLSIEYLFQLLKKGGTIFIQTPDWNSPNAWNDYTHVRVFNKNSLAMLSNDLIEKGYRLDYKIMKHIFFPLGGLVFRNQYFFLKLANFPLIGNFLFHTLGKITGKDWILLITKK